MSHGLLYPLYIREQVQVFPDYRGYCEIGDSLSMKKPRKIYLGWWINIVTSFVSSILGGLNTGASLLFKPIATDLGLDRTGASVASGIGTLVTGPLFPLAGYLTDKFGPRWVVFGGALVASGGMILLTFVDSAWSYYVVWGVVFVGGLNFAASVAIDAMVTNWFVRKRGLAFSVRFGIMGATNAAVLPLLSWLIESQGWRQTSLIWGLVALACIPLFMVFVKPKRPEYYGLLPDGASPTPGTETTAENMMLKGREYAAHIQETEFTFKQAVRTPTYWMINIGWVVVTTIFSGFSLHIVPFLTDKGISPIAAGSMVALMTFFTIPSRIFGGLVADRVKKQHIRFLLVASLLLTSAGIVAIIISPTIGGIYVLLILYGLGLGAYTPLDILLRGRYFGRKAYGLIQGLSTIISAPISFFAPIYTGWIYETTGSYTTAFILFAVLAAVGAVAMCFARVPRLSPSDSQRP